MLDGPLAWPTPAKTPSEGVAAPGSVVEGCYRIEEEIGAGAMGVVYRGRDVRLQREVAVKFMRPDCLERDDLRRQFLAEARAMARVRHANVVEIFSLGELQGLPYFVMEYVPGDTLGSFTGRHRPRMPLERAGKVFDALCRGVQAIHDAGAIHRDLKPANVLLGPRGRVLVADFGLSRRLEESTEDLAGAVAGTPAYMPPELLGGATVLPHLAPRIDVFALGVIACELLTGDRPWAARSHVELALAHMDLPPRVPSRLGLTTDAFDSVILGALAKDPCRRTSSAEALRLAFSRALEMAEAGRGPLHVLVVDDDDDFLEVLELTLQRRLTPIRISVAHDGRDALEQVAAHAPDIVLADLHMPDIGGRELVRQLRADATTRDLPIVVMTGDGGAREWRQLRALGVDGFLLKPLDESALESTVRRLAASLPPAPAFTRAAG